MALDAPEFRITFLIHGKELIRFDFPGITFKVYFITNLTFKQVLFSIKQYSRTFYLPVSGQ